MSEPIISVSGLRGIVGESLTPPVAAGYVCAFAAQLPPGPIVVTRDSRPSGAMLADVVGGAFRAVGRSVVDASIAATPTTGVLVRQFEAAGGIQISASHNPAPYNGIKLFSEAGQVISADQGRAVLDRYRAGQIDWVSHDRLGRLERCDTPHEEHLKKVLATVDVERIRARAFHVLLDANHGAGGTPGRMLLERLGCRITALGEEPTGRFVHPPEPIAENLKAVCRQVVDARADVGFCQDPDADRLAVVDAAGRYVGEEYTVALCLDHVLCDDRGPVVTNCSSSRMSEDLAEKYGVPFYRSAVGEANVTGTMQQHGALFGGEGNGGPIDPRVGFVRDSFVGMALILDAAARRESTVAALVDELPHYDICKTKISLDCAKLDAANAALCKHFSDATVDRMDGLRLDWPGRWLLVRPSNTEPIVRAIAEAATEEESHRLCREAADVLARC